jgi:hypothetical protein
VVEDVERLRARSRDREAIAGADVLDDDEQLATVSCPSKNRTLFGR